MKINIFKTLSVGLLLTFFVACSTKKDTFISRNSHALSTEYNILYNGQIALDKGIKTVNDNSDDNFWNILPIEKMQISEEFSASNKAKNPDFELAETKATKAIQKHSMNINGREKNMQIDEAYLMLGKARYYDQRFIPALDAFNYILYKYPNSSKIYEAKIWREKTNMRLGNDPLVIKNISKLLEDHEVKKQVFADANALLASSFLNLEQKDSAVAKLKLAIDFTKINQERARYRFVLAQLYQELGHKDSAVAMYQTVIDMNRKAERKFVIQTQAKKATLFDYQKGDVALFTKTFDKLINDRENRPFKDLIFHQMALFHDKQNNQEQAVALYNESLKSNSKDPYLVASNYRNLGNMYFRNTKYPIAAKYYDSTLVKLNDKTREFAKIKKIRTDLDEVILYETIANRNDSILRVVAMSTPDRIAYYEKHIAVLKEKEEQKRILEEKNKRIADNIAANSSINSPDPATNLSPVLPGGRNAMLPPSGNAPISQQALSTFYFYNPNTVAFGKVEFKKNWGDREAIGNWRIVKATSNASSANGDTNSPLTSAAGETTTAVAEQFTTDFYIKKLPTEQADLDKLNKDRNEAYYQLGIIYKEKFKENQLAIAKLEKLLLNNPEEKLVLPTLYNLYKLYQITDVSKATAIKQKIEIQFPNSRYTQIISNTSSSSVAVEETPETTYNKWYRIFQSEEYVTVLENIDPLITQFSGDAIVSKFELLKANTIGKLRGVTAFKNALQDVADNYPNSEEGKSAVLTLKEQIPFLEKIDFKTTESGKWKVLYTVGKKDAEATKLLTDKLTKFIKDNDLTELSFSFDVYNEKENFITIHGFNSSVFATNITTKILALKPTGNVPNAIVISNDNYKVIQIKKNLEAYLGLKK
ncbi:tetratricopeptide repeat protein [Flavobacterium sp. CHNK8]|uniref:type IX secretion system periplasmic lipoprotein PorW/SprE n=1 Tax=Flavobacterium sp. CHNK8 TaxID=2871165 RepID=UPI001C8D12BB|nr:tetratricopeptide repeat protein [Flavobacterium sp. CHNK8]QZK88998.1 tetratricopeptide repeat protein [Flavobacterium sp. CHNK8]